MTAASLLPVVLGLAVLSVPTAAAFHPPTPLKPLASRAREGASLAADPIPTFGVTASPASSLASATSSSNDDAGDRLDVDAIGKYAAAAGIQMSLFAGTLKLLDVAIAQAGIDPANVPFAAVAFLFYAAALKSRVFNPLNNQRPDRSRAVEGEGSKGFKDRVMPSWTPPGFVFPIMWLLIIGPIRAYSSALVYSTTGEFFHPTILSFLLHLTVGDIWNTINNTEKRYGASVVGVLGVVASVAFAANKYYEVVPLAGKLLGATAIWLVTASALIADTWRLNPRPDGDRDPLYPVVGESKTEFAWFSTEED